jgi:hypothetical protein
VVAVWFVLGLVAHLVRGVTLWLALPVSIGLAVVTVLVMVAVPWFTRRSPKPEPQPEPSGPAFRPDEADGRQLHDLATQRAHRIHTWSDATLDSTAREHAEQASATMGKIVTLIADAYTSDKLTGAVLRQVSLIMDVIVNNTNEKPESASEWYERRDWLNQEHERIRKAVDSDDDETSQTASP